MKEIIFKKISKYSVVVKALPTLSDLAEGLVQISDIQDQPLKIFWEERK